MIILTFHTLSSILIGFSNDVEVQSAYLLYGRKVVLILNNEGMGDSIIVTGLLDNNGSMVDPSYNSISIANLTINPHLVGSFNDWDPTNHDYDLILNENNIWTLDVSLPSGTHEYKVVESNAFDDND